MMKFSERYGYTKPSDVIIRDTITLELQNAICSCFDILREYYQENLYPTVYDRLEEYLWTYFLNKRLGNFKTGFNKHYIVITPYIEDSTKPWYCKLDLIEESLDYLSSKDKKVFKQFSDLLNDEFERLNFGYRVVHGNIIETTSELELKSIEKALTTSKNEVRMHLSNALELYAKRPEGDYRNSIKESISAVEVICREKTGNLTLGDALNEIKNKNIEIPSILRDAFLKLYVYTNDAKTGIRHGLMVETSTYTPGAAEALFMLVSCSAFVNYLNKKWK